MRTAVCLLPLLLAVWIYSPTAQAIRSPILFFPGITNSALDATDIREGLCNTGGSSDRLWLEPVRLLLCGPRELRLVYNERADRFEDSPGVKIDVPGFGGTETVEYMGLSNTYPYLTTFVEYFVERGYVRGKSIRAAPYDWRLAADELEMRGYYDRLKSLVEEMYQQNGNKSITLVAHSMGGPVSLHFLTGYSGINQTWKDTHINAYVPLSGAWSGGVQALVRAISGQEIESDILSLVVNLLLVPILRSLESIPWLIPRSSVFGNTVLVSTPSRDYTAADYQELFDQIGYTNGFKFHTKVVESLLPNFPAPNVSTYCYYGVNVPTPETYIYGEDLNERNTIGMQPEIILTGNGDGTVNQVSSEVCHRWASMNPKYSFWIREYDGVNHSAIINERRVLNDIALIAGASPPSGTFSRA